MEHCVLQLLDLSKNIFHARPTACLWPKALLRRRPVEYEGQITSIIFKRPKTHLRFVCFPDWRGYLVYKTFINLCRLLASRTSLSYSSCYQSFHFIDFSSRCQLYLGYVEKPPKSLCFNSLYSNRVFKINSNEVILYANVKDKPTNKSTLMHVFGCLCLWTVNTQKIGEEFMWDMFYAHIIAMCYYVG